jgi:hypothetical protein
MTVEELFRDGKGHRGGFGLGEMQVAKADRLDRLLLVLALAYWLLVGLGLVARQRYRPGRWCSTNRAKGGQEQCSAFTVGRAMLDRMKVKPDRAIGAVVAATGKAVPKWG